jgi:hypothetical protein
MIYHSWSLVHKEEEKRKEKKKRGEARLKCQSIPVNKSSLTTIDIFQLKILVKC